MNKIQNSLFETMKQFSDYASANSRSTLTIECDIQELVDDGQGLYRVGYLGNSFTVHTNNINITYSVGDKVYVLVPDGDFTKDKIIFGLVKPSAAQYATNDNSSYFEISDNLIDLDLGIIKMSSYEDTIYNEIDITSDKELFANIFTKYLKDYKTVSLSFSVQTSLAVDQQVSGNYGVTIGIPVIVDAAAGGGSTERDIKYYTLDVGNMLGNPYHLTAWTPQHLYITLDEQYTYDTSKVPTISYFCYGFIHDNSKTDIKDIWLKDISLKIVNEIPERDKTGYSLAIKATEGEYFSEKYSNKKVLTPTLRVNNKVTNIFNYPIYWFIEDTSIKKDSKFYSVYGGVGWKCLNDKTNISKADDGTETFTYITSENTYTVFKEDVSIATRYKCVVLYNNSSISSIVTLKNLQSNKFIELTSESAVFIKNVGYVNLISTVYIDGYVTERNKNNVVYSWSRYDKNGNYILDGDDFFEVTKYNDIVTKEDKQCYETRIKFPMNAIEDYNVVYCSAYLISKENNEIQNHLIGTKSYAIHTSEDSNYLLTVNNGNKIFKYDADGDSPMGEAYDGPAESKISFIEPLSYNLYKTDGQELTTDEYKYCKYKWLIPINSMIVIDRKYLDLDDDDQPIIENGFYLSSGYDNDNNLPYEIAKRYNASKTNNTVILQVYFDNCKMENIVPLNFIKEGESGTNGTSYAAVLVMGNSAQSGVAYGTRNEAGVAQKEKFVYNINERKWYFYDTSLDELVDWENRKQIFARVYKNGELLTYDTDYSITYRLLDAKLNNACFTIGEKNSVGGILLNKKADIDIELEEPYVNIIQAEITIKDADKGRYVLYAYYPIEVTICDNINLIPGIDGGFASVLYASDGTNPKWDETENFACSMNAISSYQVDDWFNVDWKASYNLTEPEFTDSGVHIEPKAKYDNGDSKNYVQTRILLKENEVLNLNNEKDFLNAIATDYNAIQEKEENNYNYISEFAKKYTLSDWYNTLDEIKILFDRETNAVYRLNTLLEESIYTLESYISSQEDYNNISIKTYYPSLLLELEALKIQIQKALNQIRKLNGKSGYEFSDLVSLISNKLTWNESIKQTLVDNLGLDVALTLQLSVDDVNKQIMDYENSLNKLKELKDYSYEEKYLNIKVGIVTACEEIPDESFDKYIYLRDSVITYLDKFDTITSITDIKDCFKEIYNNILCPVFDLVSDKLVIKQIVEKEYNNNIARYENIIQIVNEKINAIKRMLAVENAKIYHTKPIVFTLNRYEMSNINGWDGNKLEFGEDEGYLLAPQVGAGVKNPDNSFTGLVMGVKTISQSDFGKEVGLFGYSNGKRSIFLDANTGKATFGVADEGQIVMNPGGTSTIAGWQINKDSLSSGNISIIANGSIKGGKWELKQDGTASFTGGDIGGWTIGDKTLQAKNIVISSEGSISAVNGSSKWEIKSDGSASFNNISITGGSLNIGNSKARIDANGKAIFSDVQITGGSLNINEAAKIDADGKATFKEVIIEGDATSQGSSSNMKTKIGSFGVDSNSIYKGSWGASGPSVFISSGTTNKYTIADHLASGWVFGAGGNFGVLSNGDLYCHNAYFGNDYYFTNYGTKMGPVKIDANGITISNVTMKPISIQVGNTTYTVLGKKDTN